MTRNIIQEDIFRKSIGKRKLKQLFVSFLRRHGVYHKFMKNFRKMGYSISFDKWIGDIIYSRGIITAPVIGAFKWPYDEIDIWCNLDLLWTRHLFAVIKPLKTR